MGGGHARMVDGKGTVAKLAGLSKSQAAAAYQRPPPPPPPYALAPLPP
jgi:hypothetical protein